MKALQSAVAKGLIWNDELIRGKSSSMAEIAQREGVTDRYVSRMINLAFLPPKLIESIARGDVPASISLERLRNGPPIVWGAENSASS